MTFSIVGTLHHSDLFASDYRGASVGYAAAGNADSRRNSPTGSGRAFGSIDLVAASGETRGHGPIVIAMGTIRVGRR